MRGQPGGTGTIGMPPLSPWVRNTLIALFALYVVELIAKNAWAGLYDTLALWPFGHGFQPWQPLTRYFVQGPHVFSVMIGLLVLYFALPLTSRMLDQRQASQAAAAAFVGGTLLSLGMAALGLVSGPALGWTALSLVVFTLFGLSMPTSEIRLFFVLPVKGIWFAYGAGILSVLLVLADRSMGAADQLGAWGAVMAWWFLLGPGGRRRQLIQKSRKIERELEKFQVIQGGRNRDDDIVH